jgi:hypothetical protein
MPWYAWSAICVGLMVVAHHVGYRQGGRQAMKDVMRYIVALEARRTNAQGPLDGHDGEMMAHILRER